MQKREQEKEGNGEYCLESANIARLTQYKFLIKLYSVPSANKSKRDALSDNNMSFISHLD